MDDDVQRLWERALIGGLVWAVGAAIVVWAVLLVGGAWGVFWSFVGLASAAVGTIYLQIGAVGLGVRLAHEAAGTD